MEGTEEPQLNGTWLPEKRLIEDGFANKTCTKISYLKMLEQIFGRFCWIDKILDAYGSHKTEKQSLHGAYSQLTKDQI